MGGYSENLKFIDYNDVMIILKENPKESIIDYLEKLRKSKLAAVNPPTLFEDQNLQSIFGMLDPSGTGTITFRQYAEGSIKRLTFL